MEEQVVSESETNVVVEEPCVNKEEFISWLINKISRQSSMISRSHGEKIIEYLRDVREKGPDDASVRAKYTSTFRFQAKKRKFQLINVVGLGDILCLPIKDKNFSSHAMLGKHRQLIFKEDMFDVIEAAHKNGKKHRGYKGTFIKISTTYCSIPRDVVHKYVSMCKFCQKEHACYIPKLSKDPKSAAATARTLKDVVSAKKKKEFEMTFMTRCQIDILDMQNSPDTEGNFLFIGHFMDHHTKYNVLFPLKSSDAAYVARKLCRYVLGHFGLPQVMHSNLGRKYLDALIAWILQFWSTDAQIVNGNPRLKKTAALLQQRQRTIMVLIETIQSKQIGCPNWSLWLPGIQYTLNTNQFEPDSLAAYEGVYKRRPKVYSYAPSSKEIPREEDLFEQEDMQEEEGEEEPANIEQEGMMSLSGLMTTEDTSEGSLILTQMNEKSEDVLNATSLDAIPLALNGQYTIIGTGVDGQPIQIPFVNINNQTLGKAGRDDLVENKNLELQLQPRNNDVMSDIASNSEMTRILHMDVDHAIHSNDNDVNNRSDVINTNDVIVDEDIREKAVE